MMREKNPEIHLHSDYMKFFESKQILNKSWGSSGPDFLLQDYDCIGELKNSDSITDLKSAFKEIKNRTKKFKIENYRNFFIITPKYIRVYTTVDIVDWANPNKNPCVIFNTSSEDKELFIDYIKNEFTKVKLDNHLEYALDFLLDSSLCVQDALVILKNLNSEVTYVRGGIYVNAGQADESYIQADVESVRNFINKFYLEDFSSVREYIKHNYSSHLSDSKKSSLGKYYTPVNLVQTVRDFIEPYIDRDTYVLDMACGCGAFLELFDDCRILGRDIDTEAIDILKLLNFANIEIDNSLFNVNRQKYGLTDNDKLVIIGNPPYNDVTSKNKRYGTNRKSDNTAQIDEDIKATDLGRSFLKAYSKLSADYICVLHPLSYLIKKTNFNSLGVFREKYRLKDSLIFSSRLFKDLDTKKSSVEFPVVAALYEKGSMDYDFIRSFDFNIMDTGRTFRLDSFETIDGYIRKYPNKVDRCNIVRSDIDLYMYNIRDTNSLISSGNLMTFKETTNLNYVTVDYADLYKYAYLNMYKHFFPKHYLFGNLSPLVDKAELEGSQYLRDLMIIGTILKNQRFEMFDISNNYSLIHTKFLLNDYKRNKDISLYRLFIEIVNGKNVETNTEKIYSEISEYFSELVRPYIQ